MLRPSEIALPEVSCAVRLRAMLEMALMATDCQHRVKRSQQAQCYDGTVEIKVPSLSSAEPELFLVVGRMALAGQMIVAITIVVAVAGLVTVNVTALLLLMLFFLLLFMSLVMWLLLVW